MSVAAAGLDVSSIPGEGQSSPCFAFPLVDRASDLDIEKATLLKVCISSITRDIKRVRNRRAMPCQLTAVDVMQVIESEYAAKYLEFLGANPTQAAQDLVRKALPLTSDCLQTKLKVLCCGKHLTVVENGLLMYKHCVHVQRIDGNVLVVLAGFGTQT